MRCKNGKFERCGPVSVGRPHKPRKIGNLAEQGFDNNMVIYVATDISEGVQTCRRAIRYGSDVGPATDHARKVRWAGLEPMRGGVGPSRLWPHQPPT